MTKASVKTKEIVNWDAEEYVRAEKGAGWYVALVIVVVGLVALSIWMKYWSFAVLIVLSAIALVIYSIRPPKTIHYSLTTKGLSEGGKLYSYEEFKSFGVIQTEKHTAVQLVPRKRFGARVTIYFPREKGEAIVDALGSRLLMKETKMDFMDKIVEWLKI